MIAADSDYKLLLSKANDTLRLAESRYDTKTLGFLNPSERMFLKDRLFIQTDMLLEFDGGYEEAERTLMVCRPEFAENNRDKYICMLECSGKFTEKLSHRDYLGSLMGLGINRECIGDILVLEDKTLIFSKPETAEYIIQNLTKIGRTGVKIKKCPITDSVVPRRKTKDICGTVAGIRLDSVISVATGISRGKSAELIKGGLVTVNWDQTDNVAMSLKEGDVISVRGYGRMCLSKIGGWSGKGRYHITVSRYV